MDARPAFVYQFLIKQVDTPLFGPIDPAHPQHPAHWQQDFAKTAPLIPVSFTSAALDWLAQDLELDAEGLAYDAYRYVKGQYRPKAKGLTGGRLGDVGEALTYLLERAQGRDIVRVLSPDLAGRAYAKGGSYPQPDFIVNDPGGMYALEVKSTEAFNFQKLAQVATWKFLKPCAGVEAGREEALAQLGYVGGLPQPKAYKLGLLGGAAVPFPVGKGVAMSVMPVDRRVQPFLSQDKYKTPPECRNAKPSRACSTCVPDDCDVVMTRMPNEPGHLRLAGDSGTPQVKWLEAYRRWTQALSMFDQVAAQETLLGLVEALNGWLERLDNEQQAEVRAFWSSYLPGVMRARGIAQGPVSNQLGDAPEVLVWHEPEVAEPRSDVLDADELLGRLSRAQQQPLSSRFLCTAVVGENEGTPRASWTVRALPGQVDLYFASEAWWWQNPVQSATQAARIARDVLAMWAGDPDLEQLDDFSPDMARVAIQVGDADVLLGWAWQPWQWASISAPEWWRARPFLMALTDQAHADVRLTIQPDGRARLSLRWR